MGIYLLLGLVWGGSFFFTKIGLHALTPTGVVFWRLFIGALALLVFIVIRRSPLSKNWKIWALIGTGGLFMHSIPFTLFAYAQQNVTSILASIINGATPIMTLLAILIFFRSEKISREIVIGLLIGMAGLMVVLAVWQGFGENDPVAVGAMVLAICCYGIGGPFIKRFITPLNLPNEVAAFGQVGGAAVFMLPVYLTGPLVVGEISADVVLAMLALGAIGSGLAYIWYFQIIKVAGSAIANSVTYITPLVATFLGVLLLSEKLHWYEPVGAVVVIVGAMISQGRLRLNRSYR